MGILFCDDHHIGVLCSPDMHLSNLLGAETDVAHCNVVKAHGFQFYLRILSAQHVSQAQLWRSRYIDSNEQETHSLVGFGSRPEY